MLEGWSCPACGKAHAPDVKTCPEPRQVWPPEVPPLASKPSWSGSEAALRAEIDMALLAGQERLRKLNASFEEREY